MSIAVLAVGAVRSSTLPIYTPIILTDRKLRRGQLLYAGYAKLSARVGKAQRFLLAFYCFSYAETTIIKFLMRKRNSCSEAKICNIEVKICKISDGFNEF